MLALMAKNSLTIQRKNIWIWCLCLCPILAQAQDTTLMATTVVPLLAVKQIVIHGNKKTKPYVIEREIQFVKDDSLPAAALAQELEKARQQIYNTTLFTEVRVTANMLSAHDVVIIVDVKERWYIFPVPQFKPADRNLNEWLKTYKGDLNRISYGIKFVHYNLSGRRDQLRIYLTNGFTRNISFSYTSPGSNPSLTEGFSIGGGYSQNRQLAYTTSYDNVLQFFSLQPKDSGQKAPGGFVRKNWFANAGYIIRRGLFKRHTIAINFNRFVIDDSVATQRYNPNYFGNGKTAANIIDFNYTLSYNNVNNTAYPLTGKRYTITLQKRGLGLSGGINLFTAEAHYNRLWHLGGRWYGDVLLGGKIKLPFDQPYYNQQALGYGDNYLRGLEVKVIDAAAYTLARNTLRYRAFSFHLPLPFKSKSHARIPFTIFAKTYADVGYAYNKKKYDTYLNNRLLYSGGVGIDVQTLYDVTLRFEYSLNQLGKKGLFLHTQVSF
jgi:outer membrane protein assembly factor BamA